MRHLFLKFKIAAMYGFMSSFIFLMMACHSSVSYSNLDFSAKRIMLASTITSRSTCAFTSDGQLKCWGNNDIGQLGMGDTANRGDQPNEMGAALQRIDLGSGKKIRQVSLSTHFACAVLTSNEVKCWGSNGSGQLGQGDTVARGDNPNEMGDALLPIDLGGSAIVKQIVTGDGHVCALLETGQVKCWGDNFYGQLGLRDMNTRGDNPNEMGLNLPFVDLGAGGRAIALSAGLLHTCALLENGDMKCWGANGAGQLGRENNSDYGGQPADMGANFMRINFAPGLVVKQISTGSNHSCALFTNNEVRCWGFNFYGQLGNETKTNKGDMAGDMTTLPPINFGSGVALQVVAGASHTCVLLDSTAVKCWGNNASGELGLGIPNPTYGGAPGEMSGNLQVDLGTGAIPVQLVAGTQTCVVLLDNTAKCWGNNASGTLGQGDTMNRGNAATDMGDNLHPIDLVFD